MLQFLRDIYTSESKRKYLLPATDQKRKLTLECWGKIWGENGNEKHGANIFYGGGLSLDYCSNHAINAHISKLHVLECWGNAPMGENEATHQLVYMVLI